MGDGSVLNALFDLGALAHTVPQIVQLGSADFALANGLDLFDRGRMDGENLLHADTVRHAADRDGLLDAAVKRGDHGLLEEQETRAVALLEEDGVAHIGRGGRFLLILAAECLHEIHSRFLLVYRRSCRLFHAARFRAAAAEDHPLLRP